MHVTSEDVVNGGVAVYVREAVYICVYICMCVYVSICIYLRVCVYVWMDRCRRMCVCNRLIVLICYGVATSSRLLKIIGLFCGISSLL